MRRWGVFAVRVSSTWRPAPVLRRVRARASAAAPPRGSIACSVPNRLATATSPYLLQHRDNPVDWWEWEPAAFARPRPSATSRCSSRSGYSACHWCHVMAHESFEDAEVARALNEGYVAVKVDREERPDVDAVYMAATQALTGRAAGR